MTLIASRLVISESLLFVFELYRDIRHIVHRLSLIRSWDLISGFHRVDLLTSFYTMKLSWFCWLRLSVFKLTALSRQLNHYSAPFLTRQAFFYLFLKDFLLDLYWLACSPLFRVASVVIIGNLFLVVKSFYYFKLQYSLLLFSFYFLFYIYVCLFTFFLHLLTIFTPILLNLLAFSLHLPIHHHLYN